jgi:hypothetical protein
MSQRALIELLVVKVRTLILSPASRIFLPNWRCVMSKAFRTPSQGSFST